MCFFSLSGTFFSLRLSLDFHHNCVYACVCLFIPQILNEHSLCKTPWPWR